MYKFTNLNISNILLGKDDMLRILHKNFVDILSSKNHWKNMRLNMISIL